MKVSFNQTSSANVRDQNGFGYAAKMCKDSLQTLGHEVGWRDPTADIEINFIQPENWHWTGPYRIAYLPWESTGLRDGWVDALNEVDEVWTPSPIIAQWFMDAGVKKQVHVYQHGVDECWRPVLRSMEPNERFRILHHGAEALRKGGNETIQAFTNSLWDEKATLVLKMQLQRFNVHNTDHIHLFKTKVPLEELIDIYNGCHMMCYPSYGEGFGLTPLQAMATGMPVLITQGWAPYEYLLPPEMLISSHLIDSPWPAHHPGQVLQPDLEELEVKLKYFYENHDDWFGFSYDLANRVHADYNWIDLTRKAFEHLS